MAEITEWVKKIWKNRITEFPTRRELTKDDGSSEIVTVTRNEGTVSEEGDAFDADTMNNLEERIDAGFTEVNRKLSNVQSIEKIEIANGKISSGVLVVTDLIPEGKNAFAFIITSGTNIQSHTAQIWKNLNNGSVNVSFKLWSEATLVMNGTVSGILLCI